MLGVRLRTITPPFPSLLTSFATRPFAPAELCRLCHQRCRVGGGAPITVSPLQPVTPSKTSPIKQGLIHHSISLRGYPCVHPCYDLAVGVASFQTIPLRAGSSRLGHFQPPADSSLYGYRVLRDRDIGIECLPPPRTRRDQEQYLGAHFNSRSFFVET